MTKEEREVMQMALGFVASISPAFICEATHHKKNERHADNEPCPHVAKQKATYEAIEKCLANDALEKKAENARELGLNYEPEPVACVEYIPCCPDQTCPKCKAAIKPELVCVCGAVWEGQELIYTTPQRKPLTDDEIKIIWCDIDGSNRVLMRFARAIEAAHGIYAPTERKGEA